MTRAETLILTLIILDTLLGCVSLFVSLRGRRSEAMQAYGLGLLLNSVGVAIAIAPFLPFMIRKTLGNGMIAFSIIPTVIGLAGHTGYKFNRKWLAAGFTATMAVLLFNSFSKEYSLILEYFAPIPMAIVLFMTAGVVLTLQALPEAQDACYFLSSICAGAVCVWTTRAISIALAVGGSNDRNRADLAITSFCIAQIIIAVAATMGMFWVEVRKMESSLEKAAFTDELTGLPNRRATLLRFKEETARAQRQKHLLALVIFDIDNFKQFNDKYGHKAGDAVLKHVASVLNAGKRTEDVLGRIGGEEFVFVGFAQSAKDVAEMANRLREKVANAFLLWEGQAFRVTLSGGISLFPNEGTEWDPLFTTADQRLYAAKNKGRNRVEGVGQRAK